MNTERRKKVAKKKYFTPREIRVDLLHLTQEELARKLKITDGALSNKENGRRKWTAAEIIKLGKLADIHPSNIFL